MLQKPVFALPGCQPISVNTLLCDTLGLADGKSATICKHVREDAKITRGFFFLASPIWHTRIPDSPPH